MLRAQQDMRKFKKLFSIMVGNKKKDSSDTVSSDDAKNTPSGKLAKKIIKALEKREKRKLDLGTDRQTLETLINGLIGGAGSGASSSNQPSPPNANEILAQIGTLPWLVVRLSRLVRQLGALLNTAGLRRHDILHSSTVIDDTMLQQCPETCNACVDILTLGLASRSVTFLCALLEGIRNNIVAAKRG